MKQLLVILGPTAVGKTTFAIEVAKHYNTEIISADSRQIFRELKIGVARPGVFELAEVKHHLIGHVSIHDNYSAGQFEREALHVAGELFQSHDIVVCCGGSMMYVDALTKGLDDLPADKNVRAELIEKFQEQGISFLQNALSQADPEYYAVVDIHNSHRLIRALEVCMVSGAKYSSLRKENLRERPFKVTAIGLTAQRNWLYSRINRRVDKMMEEGLLEEVKSVFPYKSLNALNTVGYKELFDHLEGKISLSDAVEKIKQHSRNFAKRQLTWWRRDESIHWLAADAKGNKLNFVESVLSA